MANIPEILVAPPTVFTVGSLAITNTMISSIATSLIIIVLALLVRRKADVKPSRIQTAFEMIFEAMLEKMELAFGSRKQALKYFPWIFTIFLFLLIANQFTLIPFVESVTANGVDLFRSPASHYSLPIVFALVSIIAAHIIAFFTSPLRHIGNFIKIDKIFKIKSLKELPMVFIDIFLGILDIIGEFAKLVSVATRLFGNLFAGGIVVGIIAGLSIFTRYFVPIPFVVLGILSGLVQAFVFAMLLTLYISTTVNSVKPQNN